MTMDLYQLAEQFSKAAQVLEIGTSENKGKPGITDSLVLKQRAPAMLSNWLQLIKNSDRERRAGWNRRVAETVFRIILENKPDPLNFAAAEMNIPHGNDVLEWAVMDVDGHYSDLISPAEVRSVLSLYL